VLADGNDVSTSTEGFGSVSEVDAMDELLGAGGK